jgi:hypothetical protein
MKMFLLALIIFSAVAAPSLFLPRPAAAVEVDLAPLSGRQARGATNPGTLVQSLYQLGLALGVLLAFAAIVFGAIKYTVSAGNPGAQSDAKEWIKDALLGLLLLLGAALLLATINPEVFTVGRDTVIRLDVDRGAPIPRSP